MHRVVGQLASPQGMIGKLLKERYQIVQVLSAGAFGQTYIAVDLHQLNHPKCVVKHIKPPSSDPGYFKTTRRRFTTETEALQKLACHEQIPQLYACFEENQEFYLVQQFIPGQELSAELPTCSKVEAFYLDVSVEPSLDANASPQHGKRWSEEQCVKLLREVLSILEFVHSQGVIHCDLKPNNLIRRAADGKLFLIDFGAVQPVRDDLGLGVTPQKSETVENDSSPDNPKSQIPNLSSGYISPEQLTGYPHPNSDIYALGMIGIQALTGLDPAQLKKDPDTGEVIWLHLCRETALLPAISEELISVLNQMVRYDCKDRYQSASEALQALQHLAIGTFESEVEPQESALSTQEQFIVDLLSFIVPKPSPLLTATGVSLAASTLVMIVGIFSLLYAFGLEPEPNILSKAQEQYQEGDLEKAIAIAKSIPSNNPAYPEAQAAIKEWRHDWNIAAAKVEAAEQAFNEKRWLDVLEEDRKLPAISFWKQKIGPFVVAAKSQIEASAQQLLEKAYDRASVKDFTGALRYLKQIPPETPIGEKVQQKLAEYTEKQRIKADYLLQQAYERAEVRDFKGALSFIKQIPSGTPAYTKAQDKITEYTEQERLQEEDKKNDTSKSASSPQIKESSRGSDVLGTFQDLNSGSRLQEVIPNPVFIH